MADILHDTDPADRMEPVQELEFLSAIVRILLSNGQTTERTVQTARRVAERFGYSIEIAPGWGCTIIGIARGEDRWIRFIVAPCIAVDMRKVVGAMRLVEGVCSRRVTVASAEAALHALDHVPPLSVDRFALMAAAGAVALALVFGVAAASDLLLIAAIAAAGALARRAIAKRTANLFIQPLTAALLAGLVGAMALRWQTSAVSGLVALCPCMILVPGPHLLNGALDLVRGRISLGGARIGYAATTILMICVGLLTGLALGGVSLPAAEPPAHVPIIFDTLAAGVAVLAYGTFFSMPWQMLPIPMLVGMAAHALRWGLIGPGHASPMFGAFAACLLVGILMAPLSDRLHLPFSGCAFASVVSLIPGVFLFQMADKLKQIVNFVGAAPAELVSSAIKDGMEAFIIFFAMAAGLMIPRLVLGEASPPIHGPR